MIHSLHLPPGDKILVRGIQSTLYRPTESAATDTNTSRLSVVEAEAFVQRGVTGAVSSSSIINRQAGEGYSAAALNLKETIALGGVEEANEDLQAIKGGVHTYI